MTERSRTRRAVARLISGLIMLGWLFLPVSIIVGVWAGDWRWIVTGVVVFAVAVVAGTLMVYGPRRAKS